MAKRRRDNGWPFRPIGYGFAQHMLMGGHNRFRKRFIHISTLNSGGWNDDDGRREGKVNANVPLKNLWPAREGC